MTPGDDAASAAAGEDVTGGLDAVAAENCRRILAGEHEGVRGSAPLFCMRAQPETIRQQCLSHEAHPLGRRSGRSSGFDIELLAVDPGRAAHEFPAP